MWAQLQSISTWLRGFFSRYSGFPPSTKSTPRQLDLAGLAVLRDHTWIVWRQPWAPSHAIGPIQLSRLTLKSPCREWSTKAHLHLQNQYTWTTKSHVPGLARELKYRDLESHSDHPALDLFCFLVCVTCVWSLVCFSCRIFLLPIPSPRYRTGAAGTHIFTWRLAIWWKAADFCARPHW